MCPKIKNKLTASDAKATAIFDWKTSYDVAIESQEFLAQNCVSVHLTCWRLAAKPYLDYQHVCGDNWPDGNKNNLITIEAQKRKNNWLLLKKSVYYRNLTWNSTGWSCKLMTGKKGCLTMNND